MIRVSVGVCEICGRNVYNDEDYFERQSMFTKVDVVSHRACLVGETEHIEEKDECLYCTKPESVDKYGNKIFKNFTLLSSNANGHILYLYVTNNRHILRGPNSTEAFIEFCPKCGRSLT